MKRTQLPIFSLRKLIILGFALVVSTSQFLLTVTSAQIQDAPRVIAHPEVKVLPSKEKRWALIIGVDNYGLKGAVNDAKALRNALVQYAGFPENQIILLTTDNPGGLPSRNNILSELDTLSRSVPTDGLFLFSFSGHGQTIDNDAYLIPSDGRIANISRLLRDFSIDVNRVKEAIEEMKVRQVLMFIDSCRDRIEGRGSEGELLTSTMHRAFSFNETNRDVEAFVTLYATRIGESAYEYFDEDTKQWRGYFSKAIEEALSGGAANDKGKVTLASLVKYLDESVPMRSYRIKGIRQTPWENSSGYKESELVLALSPAANPDVSPIRSLLTAPNLSPSSGPANDIPRTVLLDNEDLRLIIGAVDLEREYVDPISAKLRAGGLTVANSVNLDARDQTQLDGYFSEPSRSRDKDGLHWLPYALVIRVSTSTEDLESQVISQFVAEASIRLSVYRTDTAEQVETYSDYSNKVRGYGATQELARRNALRAAAQRIPNTFIESLVDKAKLVATVAQTRVEAKPSSSPTSGLQQVVESPKDPIAPLRSPPLSQSSKTRRVLLHGPRLFLAGSDKNSKEELRKEFIAPFVAALRERGLIVDDYINLNERDQAQLEGDINGVGALNDSSAKKDKHRLRWLPYALVVDISVLPHQSEKDFLGSFITEADVVISIYRTDNGEQIEMYSNYDNKARGYGATAELAERNAFRQAAQTISAGFIKRIADRAK